LLSRKLGGFAKQLARPENLFFVVGTGGAAVSEGVRTERVGSGMLERSIAKREVTFFINAIAIRRL
jgi:hypothetical protein